MIATFSDSCSGIGR